MSRLLKGLKSWVQKGLLPRPQRPGLGRGKGRARSEWVDYCLTQVTVIAALFRIHYKARDVAIVLWLLGFQVSTSLVREAIIQRMAPLSFLGDLQKTIGIEAQTDDDWADGVSRWVAQESDFVPVEQSKLLATGELRWQLLLNP